MRAMGDDIWVDTPDDANYQEAYRWRRVSIPEELPPPPSAEKEATFVRELLDAFAKPLPADDHGGCFTHYPTKLGGDG